MSIVKRFNRLLGLEKIDVLVDEKDKSRHIVITDIPESLPQGKSSFLIEVSPYMRKGIELQIDFIDSKGNSIYVEPVQNYLEGTSRTVSVEVYDTVAPGIATMIIVGELDRLPLDAGNYSEVEEIPKEFQGVYNVRLTKEFIINTAEINVQPIKFYTSPRLTAVEKRFGTMIREVVSGETVSSAFKVRGQSNIQQQYEIFNNPSQNDDAGEGAGVTETQENQTPPPPNGDIPGDEAEKEKLKQHAKKKSIRGNSRFKRSRRIRRRNSPEDFPYFFTIRDDEHRFTTKEIGAEIRFSAINTSLYSREDLDNNGLKVPVSFNVVTDPDDENFPNHYTASIAELDVTGTTAYVNTPFTKQDVEGNYRILNMEATGKTHFTREPSASFSLTNIVSYADITLSHLRTFSGEVFKAKVYVRSEGSFDDYKLLAEVPVESPDKMVNNNSVGVGERTGYFVQADFPTSSSYLYWDLYGSTNGLTTAAATSTASYSETGTLNDSVMISGSTSVFTDQIRFQLKDEYKFELRKSIDYTLSFNAIGQKDIDGRALMLVYVSGSSMEQSTDLHNDDVTQTDVEESSAYGKRMGVLEVESTDDTKKDFKLVTHNFNSTLTGDAIVQFRVISGQWNLSDISVVPSTDTGFSPTFVNFQQELSPELTHKRPETLEFLTEFYDINNNLADEIAVTTGSVFTGANMVITGDDNNIPGSVFLGGETTASGMQFGGVDSTIPETGDDGATGSGFMRSVGYLGFTSASDSSLGGTPGFMIYSGSVLPGSGEDYAGVGLELVGESGSLKFRTNPSLFDVQADAFFVGKTSTQFISGSGEKIEISSSNFHLQPGGDVDMTGTITAAAGAIGGWEIKDGDLRAGVGNSSVTMSGDEQLIRMGSGSTFTADEINGVLFGRDTDGKYKFGVGKGGSYVFFDGDVVNIASEDINVTASVFSVDVDQFKLSATNLFVSSSQGGFISLGNPLPTDIDGTNKGIFMKGKGSDNKPKFLAGNAAGGHLSFDGDNVFMSSSAFFLGSPTQFVSGSLGNIEISSSNFHLDNEGNVIMSGKVTAAEGEIGGLTIGDTKLSLGTSYEISSSTNTADPVSFISSSNFKVSAGGQVTASGLSLEGGDIGGLVVDSGVISVGAVLKLKDSGQITGSKVLFTGGTIGGFTIDADEIKSTNVLIDSANEKITLGSGNAIKLQGGATDNFLAMGSKGDFGDEGTGTAGILIGMDATNPQAEFVKNSTNYFIFDDGIDIQTDTLKASGSNIVLEAPRFFLGKKTSTFVSGSNGNIEVSSSAFHLTPEGNITASNILLGDKGGSQFLQFADGDLTVRGDLAVDSLFLPATIAGATSTLLNASSSLNSTGFAKFVSASIGGFVVDSSQINSANNNIVLEADGGATISGSSINLQTPKFYFGETDNFISGSEGNIRIFSTGDTTLSGSSITLSTPKFFMGESSQFISGSNGNIEISSSKFHLKPDGDIIVRKVNADEGEIGGFEVGSSQISSSTGGLILKSDGQITGSKFLLSGGKITADVTIEGSLAANSISTPADGTKLAEITDAGFARFVSASIGGFDVSDSQINSTNDALILKSNGQITASAVSMSGTVTANAGAIGGFKINSSTITATNFTLDPGNNSLTLGSGTNIFIADGDVGIHLGHGTFGSAPFSVTKAGVLKSTSGTIGGWSLSANRFNDSGDNVRIDSNAGSISIKNHTFGQAGLQLEHNSGTSRFYAGDGSNKHLKFDGSDVDIKSAKFELDATNVEISSTHASMSLGEGKIRLIGASTSTMTLGTGASSVTMSADGSDTLIAMGDKTNFSSEGSGTGGILIGMDNTNPQAEFVKNSSNYFIFDDGIDIKTDTFNLDTTNLDINSATKRIEVSDGSNVRVRIGEVDSTSANHFGITIYDGTGTAASDEIVHLSDAKNQIASWSLSPNQISSQNLVIHSSGRLETADFASGVKGWRITSEGNGSAEFENVSIRGTLKTTVFEKETVNAVGGQLYIANSTVTTGSTALAANATTMSVVNVSGFAADEILAAKKISSTGFATEYMLVQSSSREEPSSDTNFAGNLHLIRGYRSGSLGESGSLGDRSNISQSYEPGQVIISTGKIGTGFIRLNANPNDQTTPYMDIVERTGSGVYDVDLKARLGDLSGLSSGLLFGNATPGFGLFTENVFLKGALTATTGSIEGILHVRTDLSNQVTIGTNVRNTLDGIHINDNNFWYTNGHFRTGFDSDNFIHQSGSALTIKSETFALKGGTTLILDSSTPKLVMGSSAASVTDTDNTGIYMDGSGKFRVGEDQGSGDNFIYFNGTTIQMKSTVFDLVAGSTLVINSSTPKIVLGASATGQSLTSGTGIFMNGSGHFRAGKAGHGRLEWDGTNVYVSSSGFFLGSDSQFISGSLGNLEISSSAFHLSGGNTIMSGKVTSAEGNIGGFDIAAASITSQAGGLTLNADGGITGSRFRLTGGVITSDVTILGDLSANSIATPSSGDILARITDEGFAQFISASIGGFDVDGSQINSINDALILKSSGQITASAAQISGNITITGGDLAGVSADTISGSAAEVSASLASRQTPYETQVSLTSAGMSLNKADGTSVADYGDTIRIGIDANNESRVEIDNDSMDFITDSSGTDTTRATFGATSVIGTSADKVTISDSGITLTENSVDSILLASGAVTLNGASTDDQVVINASGVTIKEGGTVRTTLAGNKLTLGKADDNRIEITDSTFSLYEGSVEKVSIGSSDVKVLFDSNNYSQMDADSFDVVLGGQTSASFGATTTIGPTGGSHVSIDSQQISVKRGTTTFLSASAAGLDMSGSIKASGGTIGGFTIGTNKIESATGGDTVNYTVTANGSSNYLIDGVAQPALTLIVGNTYVFDFSDGSNGGHPFRIGTSANGSVITDGITITSSALTIVVTASTPTSLYYFCTSHSGMGNSISVTTATPSLILNGSNGQITASAVSMSGMVNASSGQIGNFAISSNNLQGGTTFQLNPTNNSGEIRMGASLGPNSADSTTRGIYLAGSGEFGLIESATNRIFSDGNGLDIRSDTFTLDATTVYLDSATPSLRFAADASAHSYNAAEGIFIGKNSSKYKMSIKGGASDNSLVWDGDSLTIAGSITITGGNAATNDYAKGVALGAEASASAYGAGAVASGSAYGAGAVASGSAYAVGAAASASAAQTTANTGVSNAATAQAAVDVIETRVVIDNDGMSLNTAAGVSVADYGTTTRIGLAADARTEITSTAISMYSGKVSGTSYKRVAIDNTGKIAIGGAVGADVSISTTDDVIRIEPGTGITIFDSNADKLLLNSDGMTLTENSQVRAIFGAVTAIGSAGAAVTTTSTDDCIRIADGTVSIFQDNNNKAVVNSSGLTITQGGVDVGTFGSDTVITGGTLTLRSTGGTTGHERVVIENNSISMFTNNAEVFDVTGGVVTIGSSTDKVTINGTSGITIKENNKDNISLVDGTIKIGVDENDSTFVQIDSDSVDIIEDVSGTNTTVASFGLATVIGPVANEKSRIELGSGIVKIINRNGSGTDATAIQLAADGTATFTGDVTANTGRFGGTTGWVVGSNKLTSNAGNIALDANAGDIIVGTGADIVRLSGTGDVRISAGNLTPASAPFQVSKEGAMTATAGTIGGFTIGSTTLTATNFTIDVTRKSITLGSGDDVFVADGDDGIQLGDATFADAPFSVTPAGVLKAQSGTVGGFTLSSDDLTATNFTLSPSGKSITLGSGTDIFVVDGDVGLQLGHGTFASAPFSVTKAGVLKAISGTIGGWTLSSTTLTKNNITLDSSNKLIDVGSDSDFRLRLKENNGEPFLSIGNNDTYGNAGIFMQVIDSAGDKRLKFSVVDPLTGQFIKLTTSGGLTFSGQSATFAGNITANGNIVGDGSTAISSMASLGIGSVTATGTIQAEQITSTDDIAVPATGKINLDGAGGHTYIQQSSSDVLDFYVGGDNMLKIDEGNNTTTLQGNLIAANPKFFAWKSSDQIILEDADRTIIFDTEIFDVGADYNVSNGIYTAPVSGKYNFSAQIRIDLLDIDANEIRISLVTSDATYRSPFDPNFSGDLTTYSYNINVLADMDANDTAYIAVFVADDRGNSTHVHGFNNVSFIDTFFSGHLVV